MILGFKPQFEQPILDDTKIHTLREDKNNRWVKFRKINFAVGVRTKNYRQFKFGTCYNIQKLTFVKNDDKFQAIIGRRLLDDTELRQLAVNDGFKSTLELREWFEPKLQTHTWHDYDGLLELKIVHWTPFLYDEL